MLSFVKDDKSVIKATRIKVLKFNFPICQVIMKFFFARMKTPFDFPRENNLFHSRLALKDNNTRKHEYQQQLSITILCKILLILNDDKSKRAKYCLIAI